MPPAPTAWIASVTTEPTPVHSTIMSGSNPTVVAVPVWYLAPSACTSAGLGPDSARSRTWTSSPCCTPIRAARRPIGPAPVASVCRELGLPVTVVERGTAPLVGALGGVIGAIAAEMQRDHGVDLRTGIGVKSLEGDGQGHVRRARLSDDSVVECDVVLASLGSIRNTEWLEGSGLAAGFWGVGCDAGLRAFDINGVVTDSIFVVGDIARFPHVLYEYQFLVLEHWDNAVLGAEVAAHNMVSLEPDRWPHLPLPSFWSGQFGVNIKSVGVCPFGNEIIFTQGSVKERRFAAAYGHRGRIVAAVTFNHGKWLEHYAPQIERSAPFPPPPAGYDRPEVKPVPAEFPDPRVPTSIPDVILTGHDPTERGAEFRARIY